MAELRVLLSQQVRSPAPQPSYAPPTAGTITQLQLTASREQDLQALLVAQQTIADLRVCTYSVLFAPVAHTCMESHTCTDSPTRTCMESHTCTDSPTRTCMESHTCTDSPTRTCMESHTCTDASTRTCMDAHMHRRAHAHMHGRTYAQVWSLTHAQTHPRTDIYVFTQAHIHIVHTCVESHTCTDSPTHTCITSHTCTDSPTHTCIKSHTCTDSPAHRNPWVRPRICAWSHLCARMRKLTVHIYMCHLMLLLHPFVSPAPFPFLSFFISGHHISEGVPSEQVPESAATGTEGDTESDRHTCGRIGAAHSAAAQGTGAGL